MAAKKKPRGLTPKQKLFVKEYLVDLNATQAALRAGYSERSAHAQGKENLQKPPIREKIDKALAERSERTEVTADKVLRELARIAFSELREAVEWDASGVELKNSGDLHEDISRAISEVSESRGAGRETKLGIKLHSKTRALEMLGRHLGMWKKYIRLSGPDGGPVQVIRIGDTDVEF